jgi:hypothetical protein
MSVVVCVSQAIIGGVRDKVCAVLLIARIEWKCLMAFLWLALHSKWIEQNTFYQW